MITDTATIGAWTVAGRHDWARFGLAAAELLGAVLFAVEPLIVAGFVLLVGSFAFAAAVHVHLGKAPWHLAFYALVATLLLYFSRRSRGQLLTCRNGNTGRWRVYSWSVVGLANPELR